MTCTKIAVRDDGHKLFDKSSLYGDKRLKIKDKIISVYVRHYSNTT
jgi:hypothetical protein